MAPDPIDLGPDTDQVFLILYGTGLHLRGSLSGVAVQVGGLDASVQYAGQQGYYVGLDQVNVLLPRALAKKGWVDLVMTVDGKTANTGTIQIK